MRTLARPIILAILLTTPAAAQETSLVALRCELLRNSGAKHAPEKVAVFLSFSDAVLTKIEVEGLGTARWNLGQVGLGDLEAWAFYGLTGAGPVLSPDGRGLRPGMPGVRRYETMMALDRYTGEMSLNDDNAMNWDGQRLDASYQCQQRRAIF